MSVKADRKVTGEFKDFSRRIHLLCVIKAEKHFIRNNVDSKLSEQWLN